MLRIGDFARLGGVTVRALRHYEAKGLLAAAQVDPATGYRSYRFDQLAAREQIVRLVGPAARLLVVPRADHGLTQHPDEKTAFKNMGRGENAASAAEEILAFIRAR